MANEEAALRVKFDWRTYHDMFADIQFTYSLDTGSIREISPARLPPDSGCSAEYEEQLLRSFFTGVANAMLEEQRERG